MRKIKIVSDSSCDIFKLDYADFASAPMKVITDEKEFVDDENLNVAEMVEYFNKYKGKSKSSCPSVGDWLEAFGDADDVICITITSGLSGSYNSACSAKKIYETENEGKRVFVLDTLSAGPEMTLILRKAGELVSQGLSYEEICDKIAEYKEKTGLGFVLKSLKTFANNGRVSVLIAKLIGIMGICVIGRASEKGTLETKRKFKGERLSFKSLISGLKEDGYVSGKISIGHCQNESGAKMLEKMLLEEYPAALIETHELNGLCSFYAENGGILVGFEKG